MKQKCCIYGTKQMRMVHVGIQVHKLEMELNYLDSIEFDINF